MDEYSEKSEKPTRKKLKKAREKGEFAYSPRFGSSLALFLFSLLLAVLFYWAMPKVENYFRQFLLLLSSSSEQESFVQIKILLISLARWMILLLLLITVIAFVAHGWQSGFLVTLPHKKKLQKKRRAIYLLSILLTWIFLSVVFYLLLRSYLPTFFPLKELPKQQVSFLIKELSLFLIKLSAFFLIPSFIDYLLQRYFFYQEMHMTRQELKDELKEDQVSKKH